jgi:hypothetical protein
MRRRWSGFFNRTLSGFVERRTFTRRGSRKQLARKRRDGGSDSVVPRRPGYGSGGGILSFEDVGYPTARRVTFTRPLVSQHVFSDSILERLEASTAGRSPRVSRSLNPNWTPPSSGRTGGCTKSASEVEMSPAAVIAGHDPQLEKAIEVLMAELKENPPVKPKRPAYPNRVVPE